MSNKDDGGPAFGQVVDLHCVRVEMTGNTEWEPAVLADSGMRLRDYFAAKSLQGILSGMKGLRPSDVPLVAADAYLLADAMIEARKK